MFWVNIDDIKIALFDLSEILRVISFVFLTPIIFSIIYAKNYHILYLLERIYIFIIPAVITYLLYLLFKRIKSASETRTKHVIMSVALAWLLIPIIGSIPFILSNTLDPIGSFFESMSGWTTTGMTMIENPESVRKDVLFFRSLTQWIGGIGVIALALIVFMREGTISMEYYAQEVGKQKLKPRIRDTIIETWKIYSVYTISCIVLLIIAGMSPFDSINISFSALSTGGFATHSSNIGFFNNPLIEFILIIFMIIGATSFLIHLRVFEGKYDVVLRNIEFKYMISIITISVIFITLFVYIVEGCSDIPDIINTGRDVLFHSVAAITCTGFSISDLSKWMQLPQSILIFMMYIGGIYGSTAGGIKILRFVVIVKVLEHTFKKMTLPKTAVLRIGINGKFLEYEEIVTIFGLCSAYLIIALIGSVIITSFGFEELHAMFLTLSAMGNVGLTDVPSNLWFTMSPVCKIILTMLMWIGRLEVFPALILISPFLRLQTTKKVKRKI